jgi:negative regulator of sigma E activity
MNRPAEETVSVLVDGETGSDALPGALDQLLADDALKACWARYQLISLCLRREPMAVDARDVARRVSDALSQQAVVPMVRPARGSRVRAVIPIASALAAGLALVAIFVAPQLSTTSYSPPRPLAGLPPAAGAPARWHSADPVLRAKLDRLIVSHNENAAGPVLTGVMAYAAVVGHESGR